MTGSRGCCCRGEYCVLDTLLTCFSSCSSSLCLTWRMTGQGGGKMWSGTFSNMVSMGESLAKRGHQVSQSGHRDRSIRSMKPYLGSATLHGLQQEGTPGQSGPHNEVHMDEPSSSWQPRGWHACRVRVSPTHTELIAHGWLPVSSLPPAAAMAGGGGGPLPARCRERGRVPAPLLTHQTPPA